MKLKTNKLLKQIEKQQNRFNNLRKELEDKLIACGNCEVLDLHLESLNDNKDEHKEKFEFRVTQYRNNKRAEELLEKDDIETFEKFIKSNGFEITKETFIDIEIIKILELLLKENIPNEEFEKNIEEDIVELDKKYKGEKLNTEIKKAYCFWRTKQLIENFDLCEKITEKVFRLIFSKRLKKEKIEKLMNKIKNQIKSKAIKPV